MGTPWFTFLRNDSATGSFNPAQEGFLAAGDDVDPAKNETVGACKSVCLAAPSCKGITFQGEAANTSEVVKCYTKSAIHFTPSSKTGAAGLPTHLVDTCAAAPPAHLLCTLRPLCTPCMHARPTFPLSS